MSDDSTHAEKLLDVANDVARAVGARFVGFLTVGVYVAITVISTTDAMLVQGKVVHLPLLNVDVPMMGVFGFYTIAPWLILLMHTDLLLQLSALSRKLREFRKASRGLPAEARAQLRERLASFYYVQFLMGDEPSMLLRTLAGLVLWISVIIFPLALLLGVQVRFLAFHSHATTWWHRLALIGDVLLMVTIWPQLSSRGDGDERSSQSPRELLGRASKYLAPGLLGSGIVAASLLICTIPVDQHASAVRSWWFNMRNLQLQNEVLTADPVSAEVVNTLRDGAAKEKEKELNSVSPLTFFQGRDLRNGNFEGAVMPKFDLRALRKADETVTTQLQGAVFSWAQMQKVWLDDAAAGGAHFDGAQLQEASLVAADLHGASLAGTQLQHASLARARLDNAKAHGAQLQGADLSDAQLPNADLSSAQLQGANLRGANLTNVNFTDANLEGANLSRADLRTAQFTHTKMKGAVLVEAVVDDKILGADLDLTDVQAISHEAARPEELFKTVHFTACSDEQSKRFQCGTSLRNDEYRQRLTQFLVDLACADPYVARGLADQVQSNLHTQEQRWPALAVAFSTCLAPDACEGLDLLDHAAKGVLEEEAKAEPPVPVRVADLNCHLHASPAESHFPDALARR